MSSKLSELTSKKDRLIRETVINFINNELCEDIKSLANARAAVEKLENMKRVLEDKVSVAGSGSPQKLGRLLQSVDSALEKASVLTSTSETTIAEIASHTSKHSNLVDEFVPVVKNISEFEKYLKYLQWIQAVDEISSKIKSALESNSNAKVTHHFVQLGCMCKCIQESSCKHIVKYITETTLVWHTILKNKFASEFDEILKGIKWPCIPSIPGYVYAPSYDALSGFEEMFLLLLDIHLPYPFNGFIDEIVFEEAGTEKSRLN